jgi:YfiH family protein
MIKSPLLNQLDSVVHGFGAREDKMTDFFPAYWGDRPVQRERHGTRIAVVTRAQEDCGEADGMFTDQAGLLLSIATADCAPILFARTDGKEVAALHVGWRGALDGIVHRFAELLEARGGKPSDWYAAIGPSAGACCYQVSSELIEQFRQRYDMPTSLIAPRPRYLNLAGIVERQLLRCGFTSISTSSECTICHCNDLDSVGRGFKFHSYRRDRETRTPKVDVQWSVIAIAGPLFTSSEA